MNRPVKIYDHETREAHEACAAQVPGPATDQQGAPRGSGPDIADQVIQDILARKAMGAAKYGQALKAFNGRDALVDLYQELLDGAHYVRQEIEERRQLAAGARPCPVIGWDAGHGGDRAVMVYGYVDAGILHITRIDDITPEPKKEAQP